MWLYIISPFKFYTRVSKFAIGAQSEAVYNFISFTHKLHTKTVGDSNYTQDFTHKLYTTTIEDSTYQMCGDLVGVFVVDGDFEWPVEVPKEDRSAIAIQNSVGFGIACDQDPSASLGRGYAGVGLYKRSCRHFSSPDFSFSSFFWFWERKWRFCLF